MIKSYFLIAWRHLTRNKLYAGINIIGLALGISACLVIYLITHFELTYDTFRPGKQRIYRVVGETQNTKGNKRLLGFLPIPVASHLRPQLTGVEAVAGFYNYYAKVTVPGKDPHEFEMPKHEIPSPVIVAEPSWFTVFPSEWLAGNASTALGEPFKVVLTEKSAQRYFGALSPDKMMGRTLVYNDSLQLTVSGIIKDVSGNSDFAFTDFISFASANSGFLKKDVDTDDWGLWNYYSQTFVKLAEGVSPGRVDAQFPAFVKTYLSFDKRNHVALHLQPLADIHFNEKYEDSYSRKAHLPTLYGLMGIAAFILLLAAINFINLSTAQSVQRSKEIGIRKVLGSNRSRLVFQLLGETFLLTLAAVLISALLVKPLLLLFHDFIPDGVLLHPFQLSTWLFLLFITILTSLLAGFYPAKVVSSWLPALSLKGNGTPKAQQKNYLRKTLTVFQFTISLVFIIGTLVIGRQIHYMLNADMGFNKDAIVVLQPPDREKTPDNRKLLTQMISQLPGVTAVSLHGGTPAAQRHGGTIIQVLGTGSPEVDASFEAVDENYLPLYGLKLLAGRNLLPSDTIREYIVNASCAAAMGFHTPAEAIGHLAKSGMGRKIGPIVGVVNDFHSRSLRDPVTPFFLTTRIDNTRSIGVKLATDGQKLVNVKVLLASLENTWKKVYPDKKFQFSFFDETIAAFYEKEQKTARLINTAMAIAIFVSCMGLFGMATFSAHQRTREIGIRKVLGASVYGIVSMLSLDFLKPVFIAFVIAAPIGWYFMQRWLNGFSERVSLSWWLFLLAGAGAVLIALITVSTRAIKAAVANPVESLRTE
jgi:ABC-type antimicrobial peptide transport system permease subunit